MAIFGAGGKSNHTWMDAAPRKELLELQEKLNILAHLEQTPEVTKARANIQAKLLEAQTKPPNGVKY